MDLNFEISPSAARIPSPKVALNNGTRSLTFGNLYPEVWKMYWRALGSEMRRQGFYGISHQQASGKFRMATYKEWTSHSDDVAVLFLPFKIDLSWEGQ
jgi:hypothetical protein